MAKTKILYLSHSSGTNGAEICLLTLLRSIDRSRFEPVVVLPEAGPLGELISELDISIHVRPLERWMRFPADVPIRLSSSRARVRDLARMIEREGISAVQTNSTLNYEGAFAAHLSGRPHVWHVHEFLVGHPELSPVLPLPMLFRLMSQLSAVIVTEADMVHAQFDGHVESSKLQTIHTGVTFPPPDGPTRNSARTALGIVGEQPLVGVVGTLSERKGYRVLIDAAARAAAAGCPAQFAWIGPSTPSTRADWAQRIDEQGLAGRIHYVGLRPDARDLLPALDLLVLPSLNEAFPVAILEAMAAGRAVIATRCGAVPELVIDGETGRLVPVGDAQALADAIVSLVSDPPLARRLGLRGAEVVKERFTAEAYVRKFEALYGRLGVMHRPADAVESVRLVEALDSIIRHTPVRRFATLFVGNEKGYLSTDAVRAELPDTLEGREILLEFDLGAFDRATELRVDPIEDVRVAIDLRVSEAHIAGRWVPLPLLRSNALRRHGSVHLFHTMDPSLHFGLEPGQPTPDRVRLRLWYHAGEAYNELACRLLSALSASKEPARVPPIVATLYLDTGNGYQQEQAVTCSIPWVTANSKHPLCLEFPVDTSEPIRGLRFDPLEGRAVGVVLHRAEMVSDRETQALHPVGSNAVLVRDDLFLFGGPDPQVRLQGAFGKTSPQTVRLEVSYLVEAEFDTLAAEAMRLLQPAPVVARVYVDDGSGYDPERAVPVAIQGDAARSERLSFDFPVAGLGPLRGIRFDPAEGEPMAIVLEQAVAMATAGEVPLLLRGSNASAQDGTCFFFDTSDPNIFFDVPESAAQAGAMRISWRRLSETETFALGHRVATMQALAAAARPEPVLATLYFGEGQGFTAERSETRLVPPEPDGRVTLDFDLSGRPGVSAVRLDPVAELPALIDLEVVRLEAGDEQVPLMAGASNAIARWDSSLLFATPDAGVVFALPPRTSGWDRLHVEFRRHGSAAYAERLAEFAREALGEPAVATVLVDDGTGYSQDRAVYCEFRLSLHDQRLTLEFPLRGFERIVGLRFDPIEGSGIVIRIHDVQAVTGTTAVSLSVSESNAAFESDGRRVFRTDDPVCYLALPAGLDRIDTLAVSLTYLCAPGSLLALLPPGGDG